MQTTAVLEGLVATCTEAIDNGTALQTITAAMRDLFSDAAALAGEIAPFSAEDVGTSERGFCLGGEFIAHRCADLTVLVLDTLPGVVQPPHDHNMHAVIGVFEGVEEQRFWARTADGIEPAAGRVLQAGDVMALGERAIHAISAPNGSPARAIHVYLGDIYDVDRSIWHPDTLTEYPMTTDRYDEFCQPATS